AGGSFSIAIGEPHNLFPPGNCYASECTSVINQLFTGLVEGVNGKPQMRVAKSITSSDQVHFDIKLNKGWKFHNGEPVNADAFIRSWNYTAYGPNAQQTSGFFTQIKGYNAMQSPDGKSKPKAKTLSGLQKVNDYEFKVTMIAPFSQFEQSLLYTPAFAPVSKTCLNNIKACNEGSMPVGDGPYEMASPWQHNEAITVKKYSAYKGSDAGKADQITFKIYTDMSTAFRDWQAGNLDIVAPEPQQVPQAKQAAGSNVIESSSSDFTYIGLPAYVPYLKNADVRHALSLAINRKAIIKNLLSGLGTPAQSVVSPIMPGGGGDHCKYCVYNPKKAKQLMQQSGVTLPKNIEIWVNSGAGNDQWVQAVGQQWQQAFGVNFKLKELQFPQYLDKLGHGEVTGPFRLGWIEDYPSMYDYLQPIYFKNSPSNYMHYNNPQFEKLVNEGSAANSQSAAIAKYSQAEDILVEDMPVIPMYYGKAFYIYSKNVSNVKYDPLYRIDVSQVTVNK
ncbi:MAG: peptide ABC transporter substrate-binding protein, partial [Nocardioidaceae bacterium]